MAEAKRPDGKRRSPASGPGRSGEAKTGRPKKPAAKSSSLVRREQPRLADGDKDEQAALAEPVRQSIIISAERQSEQRMGFTARRAAILAAVVCVLTLTIAGPVRTYFAQRTEMNQLKASEAALREQIADLEQQKVKLADPAYIAAQARERLGFVMPGDIPYQVQLPPGAVNPEVPEAIPGTSEPSGAPWYSALWKTIADDPHGPPVAPAPVPVPVPPPPPPPGPAGG
ncbi:membrane protein [Mycolicibacterium murale]|jgi:cell division protein FtsB|uniref:Membrane protein n=1 Tax=Mycolicibacterium murale TaxID=182220 RepID=A0A7I9WIL4_9MYCO|nr:septum formation initiator family protein [Mycolicibacterium murale]MCV7184015.1 septum formation initiator family protein [Mycolicibacterium murale]GFG57514.1 membrane protein [Mycolicibacterium murale]